MAQERYGIGTRPPTAADPSASASPPAYLASEAGPAFERSSIVRRVLPPLIAIVLLGLVLSRVDFASFWQAISTINLPLYALFVVVFNVCLLFADALGTRYVYASAVAPVRYRDLAIFRAASYLPSLLNHHLGQAWLTFFMSRVYRVSAWSVAGATLLVYVTTLGALYLVVASSLLFPTRASWLVPVMFCLSAVGIGYLIVIRSAPEWLRKRRTFEPLIRAGIAGHLKSMVVRLPHTIILLCGMWYAFYAFAVRIPLASTLVVIPPLLLVGALPITPQGMGTRELVALQLLTPFVSGSDQERASRIAAASLVFAVSLTLLQISISPLCMREAYRRLARATTRPTDQQSA